MNQGLENSRASLSRRFLAFFIDSAIAIVIFLLSITALTTFVKDYSVQDTIYNDKLLEHNLVTKSVESNENVAWTVETFLVSEYASNGCKVEKIEDIKSISDECQKEFNEFIAKNNENFKNDLVAITAYDKVLRYRVIFYSSSAFLALFVIQFVMPLILKKGQTIGKKIMSIGLVTRNKKELTFVNLGLRFLVGFYLIEFLPIVLNLAAANVYGLLLFSGLAIFVVNLILVACTNKQIVIHDFVSNTMVVDFSEKKKLKKLGGK